MAVKKKNPSFEEAIQELESITRGLESGELSLDNSIKAYEKGMELRKLCLEMLNSAEKKLEYLEKKDDGEIERKPLSDPDEDLETQSSLFANRN